MKKLEPPEGWQSNRISKEHPIIGYKVVGVLGSVPCMYSGLVYDHPRMFKHWSEAINVIKKDDLEGVTSHNRLGFHAWNNEQDALKCLDRGIEIFHGPMRCIKLNPVALQLVIVESAGLIEGRRTESYRAQYERIIGAYANHYVPIN